ncbi:hypothetical protein FZ734_04940 [Campylobacter jejuni]|uniref:hypothetical protein n=2 Tax=Campylobacter coli TaxID=195 RepID=UPI00069BB003|nr:hypothetical protein [Campylobacter coli]ECQ6244988.1 hypothetical protein [Campylobacter jejuni]EAI5093144.1 hypothetical protein [Campylobacter coli]ECP6289805.1 hypothetical protein [Campylobacter coli]ECQ8919200.1 hypothetical protein [Campylobacter coli]ECR1492210.1 hypothetical protein [Campylobacter jejuni]
MKYLKFKNNFIEKCKTIYFISGKNPKEKFSYLYENNKIAILPLGFRCFTKQMIFNNINIKQLSLPFDSGFFSPFFSVASVFENPVIKLDGGHSVCLKYEYYKDENIGLGIKFQISSYEEINELALSRKDPTINILLDSTFGYYTLSLKHKFILAHYNWHRFADQRLSKGITEPKKI